jgi:putative FmdB family regulatory protein
MPIYEFVCDKCNTNLDVSRPMSRAGDSQACDCGRTMRRVYSYSGFTMPKTGRDEILGTLNQEEGAQTFPLPTRNREMHRARYEQAMAKGLDPPKPVIGRGF